MTYQARRSDLAPLSAQHPAAVRTDWYRRDTPPALQFFVMLTFGMTMVITLTIAGQVAEWTIWSVIAMMLVVPSLLWISGGAATSLIGLKYPQPVAVGPPSHWVPTSRTAVLLLVCREDPMPVARNLSALIQQLGSAGLEPATEIFVLSDTYGKDAIRAEEAALSPLLESGSIHYRRRPDNAGRKPGNIAEWFAREGRSFAHMLVLDADSRMSGHRVARMVWRMEDQPQLGLLQAGMALRPARSRFGQMQRSASRLLGPPFGAGLAAWSGETANYWGHNAMIRTSAFAAAASLPPLSGAAPFGGDILSHDIIEAAVIRRAGWSVAFDPDTAGSAEDGPQDLATFHRRNRRWCQGNLQHIRLIGARGFHPLSRLHIASGIFSFLAAPIWLALVILLGSGLVVLESGLPFLLILAVLLLPKLSGLCHLVGRRSTRWRRRIALRAFAGEAFLSSLLAPIVMLHHAAAVLSVIAGHDCGWKSPIRGTVIFPQGLAEAASGLGLVALVVHLNPTAALWLLPVAGPMICSPFLIHWLNGVRSVPCQH